MKTFLRIRPAVTLGVVISVTLGRITSLFSFFLPLKVILLASVEGVPGYYQNFMQPDTKLYWIIGLAIASILLYVITLLLDVAAKRLCLIGSRDVMRGANKIAVITNQDIEGQTHYERACKTAANGLFILGGFGLGLLIKADLFLTLLLLVIAQFAFTAVALSGNDTPPIHRLGRFVRESLGSHLKLMSSIIFMVAFIFLLLPFISPSPVQGGHILGAILSIILIRQCLGIADMTLNDAVRLANNRDKINALIFHDAPYDAPEHKNLKTLRSLFQQQERARMVHRELTRKGMTVADLNVHWHDQSPGGLSCFHVRYQETADGPVHHHQLQVFPQEHRRQLLNEEFLFANIPRERLKAPEVIALFEESPFECQICRAGTGTSLTQSEWHERQADILGLYWSIMPPHPLVKGFSASRRLPHDRLGNGLIERLRIAIDTPEEASVLKNFEASLPEITDRLRNIPLYVSNPDLSPGHVIKTEDGDILVMYWGRWSLEPMGASLPGSIKGEQLDAILDEVRTLRPDVSEHFNRKDLLFVQQCLAVEREINAARYKAALQRMKDLIDTPGP
ncbi:hypothetical protein CKO35_04040 [Ectothiorhodospira shaposhnikovii]|uniref:hypothetical protein n=1 Tax=Ectothiorhodospira shaposhnikovii TaxID=1054 RepID=UPI0019046264|nr:hypothetical protein [Ectothiorhodospira shaposhnikovii]MBK1672479.1 hypothetical protein [Ectothiorhodospira shaposhnikovii]